MNSTFWKYSIATLTAALVLTIGGCEGNSAHDQHKHDADHEQGDHHDHDHPHAHAAPHGGALVELGDHEAHIELVRDIERAELVLYVFDAHAENSVRVAHEGLTLSVQTSTGESHEVTLLPVSNQLTGESPGDASEFRGAAPWVLTNPDFTATLPAITIRGATYENISIVFPAGNE
jgi:hypothetical protein